MDRATERFLKGFRKEVIKAFRNTDKNFEAVYDTMLGAAEKADACFAELYERLGELEEEVARGDLVRPCRCGADPAAGDS